MTFRAVFFAILAIATLRAQTDFNARFAEIRDQTKPAELYAFLYNLPKGGDLHQHAGLSFYAHRVLPLAIAAKQQGYRYYTRVAVHPCNPSLNGPFLIYENLNGTAFDALDDCRKKDFKALEALTVAEREGWLSALILDVPGEGRNEFFEEIVPRLTPLIRNPYLFAEAFADNLKLFAAEGLRYMEPQWFPAAMENADGSRLSIEDSIAIFKRRMSQKDVQATGLAFRLQTTIIRFRDDVEQQIAFQYDFVDKHRDLWVGINAAGREDNDKGYALRMLPFLRKARQRYSGIGLSLHAGEKDSPGREVRDTLLLGADRIGHGVNLISDPDTMLLMRHSPYLVEVNLVSNRVLDYVPDLAKHPFAEYLRFGIPVCLNTDDRGSWDSNMTDEYFHAVKEFRLSWGEVLKIGRASLEHSFAPAELKAKMLADFNRDMEAFAKRWSGANWKDQLLQLKAEPSGYARRRLL